jgi:transcriptional regulator with XRE-family HTH domain
MKNKQLTDRIKILCKLYNIPIKTMLDKLEINKGFIYDVENKGAKPTLEKIEKIADYFDVSIDYLAGRTDVPEINK